MNHPHQVTGAYFLADDAVLQWAITLLTSLRRHEPDLPVTWIPFGGSDLALRRQLPAYNVEVFGDAALLAAWDRIGAVIHPTNTVGARLFRKFAAFDGPYTDFVFLDCDVVVQRPLTWAYSALRRSTADILFYDTDLSAVYTGAVLAEMTETYNARGWNTGFWATRQGLISPAIADGLLAEAAARRHDFAPTGEQPFFNFIVDQSAIAAQALPETDASLPNSLLVSRSNTAASCPVLHWAGQSHPSLRMPLARVWLQNRLRAREPRCLASLLEALIVRPSARYVRRIMERGARFGASR